MLLIQKASLFCVHQKHRFWNRRQKRTYYLYSTGTGQFRCEILKTPFLGVKTHSRAKFYSKSASEHQVKMCFRIKILANDLSSGVMSILLIPIKPFADILYDQRPNKLELTYPNNKTKHDFAGQIFIFHLCGISKMRLQSCSHGQVTFFVANFHINRNCWIQKGHLKRDFLSTNASASPIILIEKPTCSCHGNQIITILWQVLFQTLMGSYNESWTKMGNGLLQKNLCKNRSENYHF